MGFRAKASLLLFPLEASFQSQDLFAEDLQFRQQRFDRFLLAKTHVRADRQVRFQFRPAAVRFPQKLDELRRVVPSPALRYVGRDGCRRPANLRGHAEQLLLGKWPS